VNLRDLAANVEHDAELSWDSDERRELHVEGRPHQTAAVTAWKRADGDQAYNPREAVRGGHEGKLPRARIPASTPDRQMGR
jgi:hypothetical protein